MSDHHKLKVWKRILDFIASVYKITGAFPSHELYGLTSQIRRAAMSVALNLAEGANSGYDGEYKRFLHLSIRSLNEVLAGFEIAERLGYCTPNEIADVVREGNEIAAMLQGLGRSLKETEGTELYQSSD